ncbi:MAG: hypothetical protein JXR37_09140 [Kiritimatiellae bacterium]|nr:hypothetical protein [Kiritimatiellia bacterium]
MPENRTQRITHDLDPAQSGIDLVKCFQVATRKILRRMHRDEAFARLMYGTEVYDALLRAYAESLGKSLPFELPRLMGVAEIWAFLHD